MSTIPTSQLLLQFGQQLGTAIGEYGRYLSAQDMARGEQVQAQVQNYITQGKTALADANYEWQPGQREAMEAFVTQAEGITQAKPVEAVGMWRDLQQRGIKISSTAITQGSAGSPMAATKTLTPYEGNGDVANFMGDIGQGVAQSTQQQGEYEKDLELARQMALNGQTQQFTLFRDQIAQKYQKDTMQLDADLGMKAQAAQLDAQGSATAAANIQNTLTTLLSTSDPKNKTIAKGIMQEAQKAGLTSWDMAAVNARLGAAPPTSTGRTGSESRACPSRHLPSVTSRSSRATSRSNSTST